MANDYHFSCWLLDALIFNATFERLFSVLHVERVVLQKRNAENARLFILCAVQKLASI